MHNFKQILFKLFFSKTSKIFAAVFSFLVFAAIGIYQIVQSNEQQDSGYKVALYSEKIAMIKEINSKIISLEQYGRNFSRFSFRLKNKYISEYKDLDNKKIFKKEVPEELRVRAKKFYLYWQQLRKTIGNNEHLLEEELKDSYLRYMNYVAWDFKKRNLLNTKFVATQPDGKEITIEPGDIMLYGHCFAFGQMVSDGMGHYYNTHKGFLNLLDDCIKLGDTALEASTESIKLSKKYLSLN